MRRSRSRRLEVVSLAAIVAVAVAVLIIVLSAGSAPAAGYDIGFPQCRGAYPSNARFGIVGVNGGLANNTNPCLGGELRWARRAPGQTRPAQPRMSFYINTSNPGTQVTDWPRRGTAPAYGSCNGKLTDACSYLYGEQRAAHSYQLVAARDAGGARSAPWWLDVELTASWAKTYELNIAALQGFIAGLHNGGVTGAVGIYSTAAQWKDITGLTTQTTPTAFNGQVPAWVAGTVADLAQAKRNCSSGGFTGAAPTLAQYQSGHGDADLRCGAQS